MRKPIAGLAIAGAIFAPAAAASAAHAAPTPAAMSCQPGADAHHMKCSIEGTTDQPSVSFPIAATPGVTIPEGVTPMASGAGTMTVKDGKVTFAFSPEHLASHTAPYTFSGGFNIALDGYNHNGDFSITLNGETIAIPRDSDYCDTACQGAPVYGFSKNAWDQRNGTVGFNINIGKDKITPGMTYTFTDHIGPGQDNCTGTVYEQRDGEPYYANKVGDAVWDAAARTVSATYTSTGIGAIVLQGSCQVDGTQKTYTDLAEVTGLGIVGAETSVVGSYADGGGQTPAPTPTPTPTPTTPDPIVTTPGGETPTPAPTRPTAPVTPKPAPTNPRVTPKPVPMVDVTVQVDAYRWFGSAWFGNKISAFDDDRKLNYREDSALWRAKNARKYTSNQWQIITVRVPKTMSTAGVVAEVNKRITMEAPKLRYTTPAPATGKASGVLVEAWVIGKDAWGTKTGGGGAPQIFLARS